MSRNHLIKCFAVFAVAILRKSHSCCCFLPLIYSPLSAYNIFFQAERKRVLEEHRKTIAVDGIVNDAATTLTCVQHPAVSFEELGRTVGARWRLVPKEDRTEYVRLADQDSQRYRNEMDNYQAEKRKRIKARSRSLQEELERVDHRFMENKSAHRKNNAKPSSKHSRQSRSLVPHYIQMGAKLPGQSLTEYIDTASPDPELRAQCKELNDDEYTISQSETNFPIRHGSSKIAMQDDNGVDRHYDVDYKLYKMSAKCFAEYKKQVRCSSISSNFNNDNT